MLYDGTEGKPNNAQGNLPPQLLHAIAMHKQTNVTLLDRLVHDPPIHMQSKGLGMSP